MEIRSQDIGSHQFTPDQKVNRMKHENGNPELHPISLSFLTNSAGLARTGLLLVLKKLYPRLTKNRSRFLVHQIHLKKLCFDDHFRGNEHRSKLMHVRKKIVVTNKFLRNDSTR